MNKQDKTTDKIVNDFMTELLQVLDGQPVKRGKTKVNAFFASPAWFFLALSAMIINIIMAALIFWQRMRIDYLITKIIGE